MNESNQKSFLLLVLVIQTIMIPILHLCRRTLGTVSAARVAENMQVAFTSMKGRRLLHYNNYCFVAAPVIAASNVVNLSINRRGPMAWEQRRGKKKSIKEKTKLKKEKRKNNRRPGRFKELKALYDENKKRYYLPAGAIVKHGTTTNNLRSILENGVRPAFQQGRKGRTDKTRNLDGIYVGSCYLPYRTCLLNFRTGFYPLIKNDIDKVLNDVSHPVDKNDILKTYREIATFRYVTPRKDLVENCGLPAVLNITLKEDVYIEPDEDFVPGFYLPENSGHNFAPAVAKLVWETFGTTVLMQSIPADWISSIEFLEPHRPPSFIMEKYLLLEDTVSSLSGEHAIDRLLYNKIKAEEDVSHSASVHRYNRDLEALLLSQECFKNLDMSSRKKWYQEVVNPRQSFCAFSNQCDIKESYELLDKLSQNNNLEMLATGYYLYHDYERKGAKRGVLISKDDLDNWCLPEEFVDQLMDLDVSFVLEQFGFETHDTPGADALDDNLSKK
jgi:hypothetical protein